MDTVLFDELTERFGYWSMFIFSWLLFFGLPLPNELAASFSGMITVQQSYNPVIAFTSTYLGLISSASAAYGIGRLFGSKIENRIKKSRLASRWDKSTEFLNQYGSWAIAFSFFIPGVRWGMPYVVGISKHRFWKFCLFAYPAAFVWTTIYFQIGRAFPLVYPDILDSLKYIIPIGAGVLVMAGILYQRKKAKQKQTASES
ncbi:DedA family protein [Jeotgalibacillus campisalis]|uniref:Alkaline phosphatase n=1 Tax=Jeotgalibacillus campisalis TaxID=220754 RepID=A0A0C2RCA4_9BACL|nr:DedA family protein [Jeotgalibacillus campisalis]KIL47920.1 alkaline phosphatase [Jeotgalibacillus campisalis]